MEVRLALKNCYRHLKLGSTSRVIFPDMKIMVRGYLEPTSPNAVHEFMWLIWLCEESQCSSMAGALNKWMSRDRYLWMCGYEALSQKLAHLGFPNIRRAGFIDSTMQAFDVVEDSEHWSCLSGIQYQKAK